MAVPPDETFKKQACRQEKTGRVLSEQGRRLDNSQSIDTRGQGGGWCCRLSGALCSGARKKRCLTGSSTLGEGMDPFAESRRLSLLQCGGSNKFISGGMHTSCGALNFN
jgi:hypothetical protein